VCYSGIMPSKKCLLVSPELHAAIRLAAAVHGMTISGFLESEMRQLVRLAISVELNKKPRQGGNPDAANG